MKLSLKKPLISEKSFAMSSVGKYSFVTDINIDKLQAKEVVESMFKVNVEKINSQIVKGKIKSTKGKKGKRSDLKKIVFTLKKGQKIALFEAEKEEDKDTKKEKKAAKAKEIKNSNK